MEPHVSLERVDKTRALLTGLTLPDPPPTRIYIAGRQYRIVAPQISLPPLANTVKLILNWVGPVTRTAKNILHVLTSGGTGSTSDPIFLNGVANQIMSSWATSGQMSNIGTSWSLQSVTAKDGGGTTAQSTSTSASQPGAATGTVLTPGVSVVISWQIAEVYRGGKPRTYLPGIPISATTGTGDSTISSSYATGVDTAATNFLNDIAAHPVSGTSLKLGTVSYYTSHSVRPTPVFRQYFGVKVHERMDSQRRRNGRESSFAVTP